MYIAPLFITAKTRKQNKYLHRDDYKDNMSYMPTIEYYSTLKRKEILAHTTT